MTGLLRLVGALHARGFHPAVLAGIVMMPAVVAAGFWSDHATRPPAPDRTAVAVDLRGSFDDLGPQKPAEAPRS